MTKEEVAVCERAQGYMDLGLADLALEELEELPLASLDHPGVVERRVQAQMALGRWLDVVESCRPWLERDPRQLGWWVWSAYAARRCQGLEAAELLLLRALVHHEAEELVHYNLACYRAVMGRREEAMEGLERAMEISPAWVFRMAMADEDLVSLRGEMRERWGEKAGESLG